MNGVLIPGQRLLEEGLCLFSYLLLQAWFLVSCFFSVSPRNPLLNYWFLFCLFLWLLSAFWMIFTICILAGASCSNVYSFLYPYKFLDCPGLDVLPSFLLLIAITVVINFINFMVWMASFLVGDIECPCI